MDSICRVLLVGIYDRNTVSLAPHLLYSYAARFPVADQFDIETIEFSIFSDTVDRMVAEINARKPDIIGFSAYIWNIEEILTIAARIKGRVIIGGPMVTGIEADILERCSAIEIVVTGEGEATFVELLEYFVGQRALESIAGITTRSLKSCERELLPDLDSRPSPYKRIFLESPELSWISYESSRGCPFMCGFCTWGYSARMRYHSEDRVLADLSLILAQPSIKNIYFCDSSLLLQKDRAKRILRFLVENRCDKEIRFEFDAEQLDDELIDLLARLPGDEFNFGLQTINPEALAIAGRRFNRLKFEENYAKVLQTFPGANVTIDLIYGLPGDSYAGYSSSLDYVMALDKVRRILTNPLLALPGSRFFKELDKHGLVLEPGSYLVTSSASFSVEDMRKARRLSLYVSLVYMNTKLLEAVRREAVQRGEGITSLLLRMFSLLDLADNEFDADMVPATISGFKTRNSRLAGLLKRYDQIVAAFNSVAAVPLNEYEGSFSAQYYTALARG